MSSAPVVFVVQLAVGSVDGVEAGVVISEAETQETLMLTANANGSFYCR